MWEELLEMEKKKEEHRRLRGNKGLEGKNFGEKNMKGRKNSKRKNLEESRNKDKELYDKFKQEIRNEMQQMREDFNNRYNRYGN